MHEIDIPAIIDAHLHLRQGDMMDKIAHYSGNCSHIIAMPNTTPPIHDQDTIIYAREQYECALGSRTHVHMTAKLLPRTTPKDVITAKNAGAIGFKLYPQGVTTNSDDGVPFANLHEQQYIDVIGEIEKQGMVLLCHGEAPGFVMYRESLFLPWFRNIAEKFPKLRMTLEHISTAEGIETVKQLSQTNTILGTITIHHATKSLNDLLGGKLRPDLFCMPVLKYLGDQQAILDAALSGLSCFACGSDSAPHEKQNKYCSLGCAGVFSAPVLLESWAEVFYNNCKLQNLASFMFDNAARFYGFNPDGRRSILRMQSWIVPATAGLVVPFRAGEVIDWSSSTS